MFIHGAPLASRISARLSHSPSCRNSGFIRKTNIFPFFRTHECLWKIYPRFRSPLIRCWWSSCNCICDDGKLLASADGTVKIWESRSGREAARIADFGSVGDTALSPDGRLIGTVIADSSFRKRSVRLQLWRNGDLIHYACEIIILPLTRDEWNHYLPEHIYSANERCPQFKSVRRR